MLSLSQKKLKTTHLIISCVRSAFLEFTFIRNVQSQTFEIRGCIITETVEELYDKNT